MTEKFNWVFWAAVQVKLVSLCTVVPDDAGSRKVKGADVAHSYSCACPRQESVPKTRIRIWNLVMFSISILL